MNVLREQAYEDKKIKILSEFTTKDGVVSIQDKETLVGEPSPIVVKADMLGTGKDKVITSILQDINGVYNLHSAFIPRFNKVRSVYPFTINGELINDAYVNTGLSKFLRFGEKQSFDTFLNCRKDDFGMFPMSSFNVLSRGAVVSSLLKRDYKGFYYLMLVYLLSMPSVYFGHTSNTGGSVENQQLDAKSSFQVPKNQSSSVFALNEGTNISSGLYRNNGSQIIELDQTNNWKDENCSDVIEQVFDNKTEKERFRSNVSDSTVFPIHHGRKGWASFWLDLSALENVEQKHLVEDFESYAVGNDPSIVDPTHWTKVVAGGGTFTVQNVAGSQMGRLRTLPFGGPDRVRSRYMFDIKPVFPCSMKLDVYITMGAWGADDAFLSFYDSTGAAVYRLMRFSFAGALRFHAGYNQNLLGIFTLGVVYEMNFVFLSANIFDVYINGVLYNNSGNHYYIQYSNAVDSLELDTGANNVAVTEDFVMDDIVCSWIIPTGYTSWIEVSEDRLFVADALSRFYFNIDQIYNEGNILYRGIDLKKPHRITFFWDYLDPVVPWNRFQLDDHDPVDFAWEDGGSALTNGFAINALRIVSSYSAVKVFGFVQSGDFFPWVFPEINKEFFMPFNLDLLEKVTGILGPNRRDTEGFKNLRATQPITIDFSQYILGNIAGQGSWTARASDDRNGTTELHDIVECGDTDAFFALKGLQPYGYEGFTRYIEGQQIKDVNGWNNWNAGGNGDFTAVGKRGRFIKTNAVVWTVEPVYMFATSRIWSSTSDWIKFTFVVNAASTSRPIVTVEEGGTTIVLMYIGPTYLQCYSGGVVTVIWFTTGDTITARVVYEDNTHYKIYAAVNGAAEIGYGPYENYLGTGWNAAAVTRFRFQTGAVATFDIMIDDIITSWLIPGPDVLATTPVGKGRVLKIYDNSNALNISVIKSIISGLNGRISFEIYLVNGAAGNYLYLYFMEGVAVRLGARINVNTGLVSIQDNTFAWVSSTLSVTLNAVTTFEIEWSSIDRNADANPDARVIINGVHSLWVRDIGNPAATIDGIIIETTNAELGIECYINDITVVATGLAFNSAITKPQISYPDGDFLDVRYLQRARYPVDQPYVRLMNASGNGTEQRLVTLNNTAAMDHRVDEVNTYIPSTLTNYRVLGAGGVNAQWTDGLIPNHWLPLALTHQIHAKYPRLFTHDTFYNRYQFCYSAMTALITEYSRIIVANLNYENCAEMEFTPSVHPFIHPNNIAFYRDCGHAFPEKFGNSPQRMRKSVLVPQEFMADYPVDGNIVTLSPHWTDGGGASATEYLKCVMDEGKRVGKWNENLGAGTYIATYTFPMPSPTIPGNYSVKMRVKDVIADFYIEFGDAAAPNCAGIWFNLAGTLRSYTGGAYPLLGDARHSDRKYVDIEIFFVGKSSFYVIVDGVKYDNAGVNFANIANFVGPITRFRISSNVAGAPIGCFIEWIIPTWKKYPDIDADDFIIHPQYLGHAKPIEIVGLDDRWGFRDYGKYTAVSNAHPTKSWASFFVTAPYGIMEAASEIIFYDTAGNQMLYLKVIKLNATDVGVSPNVMLYASTSTGGLTTIDGSWNGWLPVTVEFDNDSRLGSIRFHDKVVASNITLGAGALVGFGKVVFIAGLRTIAPVSAVWRQEDFQSYAQGAAPGAPWTIVIPGGTPTFTAQYEDGDARGYFNDVDAANTMSARLTFPVPSLVVPGVATPYSIKWSQKIMTLANNGYTINITAAAPANGTISLQVRPGGALWNDAGLGLVNTNIVLPFPTLEHEIIVQFVNASTFNVYVDGVLQNAVALGVFAAFIAVITDISFYTSAAADNAQVYFDDIDVSWSDCKQAYGTEVPGSLLVDGIQFGGYDNSNKSFIDRERATFMLPYRDYENPHHSTFHNNLNGLDQNVIPLPPYNAVPDASLNIASWTRGNYWDYYTLGTAGMYGGVVRNWYAHRFPYVFGGRFDEPNKDVKSIARLWHDVGSTDKKTSGKWEFVMHGNARQVHDRKDDFTVYLDGQNINGLNGWTIAAAGTNTILINGYEGKKVLNFNQNDAANGSLATNTISMERTVVSYLHFKVEKTHATEFFTIYAVASNMAYISVITFDNAGMITVYNGGVTSNVAAYLANTEYDVTIKMDKILGRQWIYINNVMYGGMAGYAIGDAGALGIKTVDFRTLASAATSDTYLWDYSVYDEPGSVDVTLDYDHLHTSAGVDIPTPPMDICEKWQLQFVPAVIGTKAIIQGDGIVEDFQQYLANVVPTTGWTIGGTSATSWLKTKDITGNIVGEFSDADAAVGLFGTFTFPTASINPVPLRSWVSYDVTVVSLTNHVYTEVWSVAGANINARVIFKLGNDITASNGAGEVVLTSWTAGIKYHVQIIVISVSNFDVIINNVLYDNAGAHYTCINNWSIGDIGRVRFTNVANAASWNVYIDNIAASWLRDPATVANYDKAKVLHKYTVEWSTGFIRTKIDDKIVDYRRYAGRLPFYLDKFKAHVTSGYGLHEEYAVMFGAHCDNESNFHDGCLDLIPGGTMENEGATGHLISRNDGVYTLENVKDVWDWANLSFWKRLSLNASSLPVLTAARDIHDDLIEYCKSGASFYSLARNNVENYNKTHTGAQVGAKNTDLETYGKFFSLFANDHTADADKASMALFDVYTFTNGKISSTFKFSVLGLVGSLARLFGVYAVQLSEIADMQSLIHNTSLVANKTGYELKLSYSSVGPKDAIDLGEERTLVANELLVRRNKPSVAEFKELLSLIFGLDEEYIRFTESENTAQVTVLIPYPQPDGLFNQLSWKQYLSNFIEKFRTLGITFIYTDFVFTKSENASGKWSESYAQVLIS